MIYYVCKYTPIELFEGFGETCAVLEEMRRILKSRIRLHTQIYVDSENLSFRQFWKEKQMSWFL